MNKFWVSYFDGNNWISYALAASFEEALAVIKRVKQAEYTQIRVSLVIHEEG